MLNIYLSLGRRESTRDCGETGGTIVRLRLGKILGLILGIISGLIIGLGLRPSTHILSIFLPGCHSWGQSVVVEPPEAGETFILWTQNIIITRV